MLVSDETCVSGLSVCFGSATVSSLTSGTSLDFDPLFASVVVVVVCEFTCWAGIACPESQIMFGLG